MGFPAHDPQIATVYRGPHLPDGARPGVAQGLAVAEANDNDLDRLQSCLDWLNRERALIALEAADRHGPRRLPRASQLDPVPGLAPSAQAPERNREKLPFVLAPPLACDRLPRPLPERQGFSGTMLAAVVAAALAGSIAYRMSVGSFPLPSVAHAASFEAPSR
jgi:hypothetical protein